MRNKAAKMLSIILISLSSVVQAQDLNMDNDISLISHLKADRIPLLSKFILNNDLKVPKDTRYIYFKANRPALFATEAVESFNDDGEKYCVALPFPIEEETKASTKLSKDSQWEVDRTDNDLHFFVYGLGRSSQIWLFNRSLQGNHNYRSMEMRCGSYSAGIYSRITIGDLQEILKEYFTLKSN